MDEPHTAAQRCFGDVSIQVRSPASGDSTYIKPKTSANFNTRLRASAENSLKTIVITSIDTTQTYIYQPTEGLQPKQWVSAIL